MGEHDNTVFVEEVRTELLSMFTGMALQGLAASEYDANTTGGHMAFGREAVSLADAAITALEEYHLRRKEQLIAERQKPIDLGSVQ